ncbi:MAG TPA: copper resistance protein CopC [Acidimicrobiales bacterium]|nr:copper resistance protein CopC [Acidimicrobiales bacterium]
MIRRLAAVLGLVVIGALVPATAAGAHASLRSTSPATDEVVVSSPPAVELVFDEAVNGDLGGVKVVGPKGARVERGRLEVSRAHTTIRVPLSSGPHGTYTVAWRVVSEDGHALAGSFFFHVGRPTGGGAGGAPDDGLLIAVVAALGRWFSFAGLLVALGALALGSTPVTAGDREATTRVRRVAVVAAVTAAAGALIALIGAVADASGRPLFSGLTLVPDAITGTRLGRVGAARVAFAALLAVAAGVSPWWRGRVVAKALVLVPAVALVFSTSVGGHAWTTSPRPFTVATDAVHLAAASVWIGGLVALVMSARVARSPEALTSAFSRLVSWAALAVFITGSISAWEQVRSMDALRSTTYGRLLAAKIAGAVVILGAGFVSRRALRRGGKRLFAVLRTVRVEIVVAALVLAATAVLVDLPPARVAVTHPFASRLPSADGEVRLSVTPGKPGPNTIEVSFITSGGAPRPMNSAEMVIAIGDASERLVALRRVGVGRFRAAAVRLESPGAWRLTVGGIRAGVSETVTFEVPVR